MPWIFIIVYLTEKNELLFVEMNDENKITSLEKVVIIF